MHGQPTDTSGITLSISSILNRGYRTLFVSDLISSEQIHLRLICFLGRFRVTMFAFRIRVHRSWLCVMEFAVLLLEVIFTRIVMLLEPTLINE